MSSELSQLSVTIGGEETYTLKDLLQWDQKMKAAANTLLDQDLSDETDPQWRHRRDFVRKACTIASYLSDLTTAHYLLTDESLSSTNSFALPDRESYCKNNDQYFAETNRYQLNVQKAMHSGTFALEEGYEIQPIYKDWSAYAMKFIEGGRPMRQVMNKMLNNLDSRQESGKQLPQEFFLVYKIEPPSDEEYLMRLRYEEFMYKWLTEVWLRVESEKVKALEAGDEEGYYASRTVPYHREISAAAASTDADSIPGVASLSVE